MRARLDIDLRLEHAARSLSNFLEDDLSAAYLGLGSCARTHLDRFRSFLQSFYVGRYGYWPPAIHGTNNLGSSHAIFRSMYLEFRNLYECLVDTESGISIRDQRLADGGLCVFQNVTDFATRHSYVPLPHPLPLLPESVAGSAKSRSAATLDVRKIRMPFGGRQAKQERRNAAIMALSAATNHENPTVKNCPLVREYMRFEHTCASKEDEKIPLAEARKVRWILIYSIFQVLVSVNRAPDEVRDTGGVSYPLCVRMIGEPPWKTRTKAEKSEWKANRIDIKPDADPLKMGPNSYKESSKKRQARSNPLSNLLDRGQARDLKPEEVDSDSGSSSSPASGWSIKSASSSNDCLTNMDHVSVHSSTKEHESKKMSESSAKDRGGPNVSQRVS